LLIGKVLHYFNSIDSTNEVAKNMLSKSKPSSGTAIIADFQTKGKGQQTNIWESDAGKNLLCSIIIIQDIPVDDYFYLNKIVSISIVEALDKFLPDDTIEIKWPNDILVNQKKIAGILIENSINNSLIQNSIIGMGINLNQIDFNCPTATSAIKYTNTEIDIPLFTKTLFESIDNWYQNYLNKKFYLIDSIYLKLLYGVKNNFHYSKDEILYEGKILSINKDGSIVLINSPDLNTNTYYFKQIKFLL
jgi:BirA family biotin operon repressor/biotin-[acetyl-CoA-carboxylase] ligase